MIEVEACAPPFISGPLLPVAIVLLAIATLAVVVGILGWRSGRRHGLDARRRVNVTITLWAAFAVCVFGVAVIMLAKTC